MPATGASSPPPNPPVRILLVDDDAMISQLVVDLLSLEGYDVDTAPNGIVALEKIQRRTYDLILSDLQMPELDGAGLYRELTERQAHPPGKFIFLTGTADASEVHHLVQDPTLPVLQKPFNVADLLVLVRKVLSSP
jgi:DNA-binding response OmpR family regulator